MIPPALIRHMEAEGMSKEDAEDAANRTFDAILTLISEGKSVRIEGIGTLKRGFKTVSRLKSPAEGGFQKERVAVVVLRNGAKL